MTVAVSKRAVIVRTQVVGLHYWNDAPPVVGYLGEPHRHVFGIQCEWGVTGDDREVEFHIALSWVQRAIEYEWGAPPVMFGPMSCEMIAKRLGELLDVMPKNGFAQAPRAPQAIEVWEDQECGARVELVAT